MATTFFFRLLFVGSGNSIALGFNMGRFDIYYIPQLALLFDPPECETRSCSERYR